LQKLLKRSRYKLSKQSGVRAPEAQQQVKAKSEASALSPRGKKSTASTISRLRVEPVVDYGFLTGLVGFWIRRGNNKVLTSFHVHLSDLRLRPVEVATLLILESNTELSQIVLAAILGSDQSTLVGVLANLEQRGVISRRRSGPDRRFQVVKLSKKGHQMLDAVKNQLTERNAALLSALSQSERQTMLALLKKFVCASSVECK
jgi:DNA-binding MarR family transcriptional regulator